MNANNTPLWALAAVLAAALATPSPAGADVQQAAPVLAQSDLCEPITWNGTVPVYHPECMGGQSALEPGALLAPSQPTGAGA